MRKAFIFSVVSQIGLAIFLLTSHAQPVAKPPTRGDGLAAKLKVIEPKLEAAFAAMKEKAEGGDAAAQDRLSRLLIYGQGMAVDLKAAFEWAEKSAQAGHGLGQLHLGLLYRKGTGTEPDEKKSNELFAEAAKTLPALVAKKNPAAMRALATLNYRGWGGLKQDRVKALKLNQQAADAGDPLGMVEVADQLWDAKGTHRQRSKAKRLFQKALPLLMTLGEAGDRRAQYVAGNLLAGLRLGTRDFAESIKWHQPGADTGYASAEFIIGARHQKGHGTPKNDIQAMIWYNKAAAQGHAGGINNVGWMHSYGRAGDPRDGDKASAMYLRAAERGNEVSQNNIGMRYYSGAGVAKDLVKAFEWHKRSAENDYGRGQYYLALRFDSGEGTNPDLAKAVYWYQRAGENDLVDAQVKLAQMFHEGRGVKRDLAASLNWLARVTEFERDKVNPFVKQERMMAREAAKKYVKLKKYLDEGWPASPRDLNEVQPDADKGMAAAQYELAALFAGGIGGAGENSQAALQWATKAAAQGHPGAQYFLGICHEEGRHVARSSAKAKEWYGKAAAQGHAAAQNNLAVMQEEAGSAKESLAGYTKAAKTDANAAYNLARLLEAAQEPDQKRVFLLYEQAAHAGHAQAQNNLGYLYQTGQGTKADLEEAARWYESAANQGNLDGMFNFGLMTLKGQGGIQADRVKAFVLWGRAAMKAHPAATKHLVALANQLTEAEKAEGRAEVQAWTASAPQRVLQHFVIRKGD
jgi:TPR repeat protein